MIKISIQKLTGIFKLLLTIFILLLILHIIVSIIAHITGHFSIYGIVNLFNFDKELSIPTYFSALNLLVSFLLLYMIYRSHKNGKIIDTKYWGFLSIFFLYLSIDEIASIHEKFNRPIRYLISAKTGPLYYVWVLVAIAVCIIIAIYLFRFYLRLPNRYKVLFGISALLFVGGTIGFEMIGGCYAPGGDANPTVIYTIIMTIEESLEMTGIILFNYSLIDYIKSDIRITQYNVWE